MIHGTQTTTYWIREQKPYKYQKQYDALYFEMPHIVFSVVVFFLELLVTFTYAYRPLHFMMVVSHCHKHYCFKLKI